MDGVSAGHNIIVAGHGAQIIEGTYVDHRSITIVLPANADAPLLSRVAAVFGLNARPPAPMAHRLARVETRLGYAARCLNALKNVVIRKRVHIPHDLAGLRSLQKEIEHRIAVLTTEGADDFSWLANAPSARSQLTGFRFQREFYGLTAARVPPIRTRFSDGSFAAYYAASDVTSALFEAEMHRELAMGDLRDYVFISVEIQAERILDLRDQITRQFIEIHSPRFFEALVAPDRQNWSLELGKWLVKSGFDGFVCDSRISIGRQNIVLFPSNFSSSALEIKKVERYGLNE